MAFPMAFKTGHDIGRAARRICATCMASACLLTVSLGGAPAFGGDTPAADAISQMEDQLLDHDYKGETDGERLDRLERFVFGAKTTGATKDRIAGLRSAIAAAAPRDDDSAPADLNPVQAAQPKAAAVPDNARGTYTKLDYGNYPRVTELEQQLLGKTYVNDSLPSRVARLEVKQFGKASPGDLCDRIDKLDQCVKPKTAVAAAANARCAGPAGSPQAGGDGQTSYTTSDYGSYPRVTELEQMVLGQTYVNDPLPERVARLETKKFGKTSPEVDLCDRIDRLDQVVKPRSQTADRDSGEAAASRPRLGGMLGRALLGLVGGSVGGGIGNGMFPSMLPMMGPGARSRGGGRSQADTGNDRSQKRGASNAAPDATSAQNPFAPGAEPVTGAESRIAVMERFVFGVERNDRPPQERVQRLEKKLVPYEHHETDPDLPKRIDHLWSILAAANGRARRDAAADQQGPAL